MLVFLFTLAAYRSSVICFIQQQRIRGSLLYIRSIVKRWVKAGGTFCKSCVTKTAAGRMNAFTSPTGYPLRLARCVGDEDNRAGIIFAQQLGKVIKGSQILSQGCSSKPRSVDIDTTFHLTTTRRFSCFNPKKRGPWPINTAAWTQTTVCPY